MHDALLTLGKHVTQVPGTQKRHCRSATAHGCSPARLHTRDSWETPHVSFGTTAQESVTAFLTKLERHCKFSGLQDTHKAQMFALLLQGIALEWSESLQILSSGQLGVAQGPVLVKIWPRSPDWGTICNPCYITSKRYHSRWRTIHRR